MYHQGKDGCAYCGSNTNLTREHVCPRSLDKIIFGNRKRIAFIGGANKNTLGDVTVRDVCASCNNGVLAELDAYGNNIALKYLRHFLDVNEIEFEYNYNLLLRWILKVLYNASRAYKTPSTVFRAYIPFILGVSNSYPPTIFGLNIWRASKYKGETYFPNYIGFSNLYNQSHRMTKYILGAMFSVQSYAFTVIGWSEGTDDEAVQKETNYFVDEMGLQIMPSNSDIIIVNPAKSKLDYVQHRINQVKQNPQQALTLDGGREMLPSGKLIPITESISQQYRTKRVRLIRLDPPAISIMAIEDINSDLIKTDLTLDEAISNPELVPVSLQAIAQISRAGAKTYIRLSDLGDLQFPYFSDTTGVFQPQSNWAQWRLGIRKCNNILFLASIPSNMDMKKLCIVCAVRVNFLNS